MALFDHQYRITEFFKSDTGSKCSQKRHRSAPRCSSSTATDPLQNTPPKIRCLILKSIPNLVTLIKAAGSSPCLWRLYALHKEIINECVLRNEISPAVFPLAIAADWQLREEEGVVCIVDNQLQAALNFADNYLRDSAYTEGPVPESGLFEDYHFFRMQNAIIVSNYHGQVDYLAQPCAHRLQAEANQTPLASAPPVSATEVFRYQRATYLFEVIGTVFRTIRQFDRWDRVLLGGTECMPFYEWLNLDDDQRGDPWERKMWTWLWIFGFGYVGLYPEIDDDYIEIWWTTSLKAATLFWDEK